MQLARRLLVALHRGQQGQAVMWMIGLTVIALMTGAIAVDLGVWLRDLRFAQNKADAVVLAAVLELPQNDEEAAEAKAREWFVHNIPADMRDRATLDCCEFLRDSRNRPYAVQAEVTLRSHSLFARLIGFGDPDVKKKAAAARYAARGSTLFPWAIFCQQPGQPNCGVNPGIRWALHAGQNNPPFEGFYGPGNWGPVDLVGRGNRGYTDCIRYAGTPDAVNHCNQLEVNDGQPCLEGEICEIESLPGIRGNTTCQALYERVRDVESDVPDCRTRKGNEAYCDAANKEQAEQKAQDPRCWKRLGVIPVTDPLGPGKKDTRLYYGFTVYIAGWTSPKNDQDGQPWVWGYWLENASIYEPWQLHIDPNNPGTSDLEPMVAVLIDTWN
jgi:hypothetical protein